MKRWFIIFLLLTANTWILFADQGLEWMRRAIFPWTELLITLFLFFIFIYFICKNYRLSRNTWRGIEDRENKEVDRKEKMLQYFKTLLQESESLSNNTFFKRYNSWVRWIFLEQWISNAHRITLSELNKINKIEANAVFIIFKKSYKNEYSDTNISLEMRKKYIKDILWELHK